MVSNRITKERDSQINLYLNYQINTFEVSVTTTGLPALLDAITGDPASQGLAGTGYGMDLLAQLSLPHTTSINNIFPQS